MEKEELIREAFKALQNSYSPYSHYPVGAAVCASDGTVIYGANIENASYPAGICGKRNAVFAAYARGYRKDDITALAIVSRGHTVAAPCGVCRQVLAELLNRNTPIYLSNGTETIETNMAELLPMPFGPEDLD